MKGADGPSRQSFIAWKTNDFAPGDAIQPTERPDPNVTSLILDHTLGVIAGQSVAGGIARQPAVLMMLQTVAQGADPDPARAVFVHGAASGRTFLVGNKTAPHPTV